MTAHSRAWLQIHVCVVLWGFTAILGRLITLRAMLAPAPVCSGYFLFRHWVRDLSFMEKVKSFVGTARRVGSKKLRARRPVEELAGSRRAAEG